MSISWHCPFKEEGEDEEEVRSSRSPESMYEMGPEMDSLTHSLEHLDSQVVSDSRDFIVYQMKNSLQMFISIGPFISQL